MGYQSPLPPHPGPTECLQEGLYANCSAVVLFQIWHAHKTIICIFRVCMNSNLQCKVHEIKHCIHLSRTFPNLSRKHKCSSPRNDGRKPACNWLQPELNTSLSGSKFWYFLSTASVNTQLPFPCKLSSLNQSAYKLNRRINLLFCLSNWIKSLQENL